MATGASARDPEEGGKRVGERDSKEESGGAERRLPCRPPPPAVGFATTRTASLALCGFLIFLNVFAFLLAVGAEQRRSTGKVVPDEYDERSYCLYDTDASTVYGVCAFFVLLLAQLLVSGVTRCLCFGPVLSFTVSWCASLKP
ncbi:uncharacterized protein LOC119339523 [Triticum dicoccoides]|uniref:uncharacterized protein LOC119339523 n=1 Tax=Triticum dicoccoides TaxID=85692 RepID=UPI0018914AD1|nr:uncharacterized protein LOC119339523 [Triticum dicoccoides]